MIGKNKFTFYVLVLITVVFTWTVFNISKWRKNLVINNDAVSYYSYLPATFIYKDLTFSFVDSLPKDFEGRIWYHTTSEGRRVQKMTLGLSVLYSPFFFIAHVSAHLLNYNADGYSKIYGMWICLAALFYGISGLILLSRVLLKYFTDKISALVILILAFGTNFFFYVTNEGEMSHAFSFFLFSAFLYFSIAWNTKPSFSNIFGLGIIGGLIVLVRPSNMVAFLIPFMYGIYDLDSLKIKLKLIFKNWVHIILFITIVFLIFSPQLFYWKFATGKWFYYSYGDEGFFFSKPQIINGFFSYRKGWLIYTPIMIFALAGIPFLNVKHKEFFYAITVFFGLNVYIIFSWWSWWYGGGFGARPLIESYVFLSIPMAVFIDYIFARKRVIKIIVSFLIFAFISLNLFQSLQYRRTLIHWDSMTKESYWAVFGKLKFPKNYKDLIKTPDYESALKGQPEKKK